MSLYHSTSWSVDFAIDGQFYADNDHAPLAGGTLTHDPLVRLQTFLNYTVRPYATLSVGGEGVYGGESYLDSLPTGQKTEFDRLRLGGAMFFAPTWDVLSELDHDVNAVGDFREQFGATLRLLHLF